MFDIYAPAPGDLDRDHALRLLGSDPRIGHDTEFTGGGIWSPGGRVRLAQFANEEHAVVLDLRDAAQTQLYRDLVTGDRTLVVHSGIIAEVPAAMRALGVDISPRIYDTMTNTLLVYPGEMENHGLKDFAWLCGDAGAALIDAERTLHAAFLALWRAQGFVNGKQEDITSYGFTNIDSRHPAYLRYAALDAIVVRRFAPVIAQRARDIGVYGAIDFEQRVNASAARMHLRGWQTSRGAIDGAQATVGAENRAAIEEFETRYEIKARSPKRIQVMSDQGVVFRVVTDKGNPKTSKEVLRELIDEYPDSHALDNLLRIAETSNLTTFLNTLEGFLDADDIVHPWITTLGAVSGRWRVSKPGVQTASTKSGARKVFVPRPGNVLLSADLGQIEPRVAFALSGQKELIELCKQGIDPYAAAAITVFGAGFTKRQRKVAKRIVLGTMFMSGIATLYRQAKYTDGILDISEQEIGKARDAFRRSAPNVMRMAKRLERLPDIRLPSGRYGPHDPARMYRAINTLVQGSARDFLMQLVLDVDAAGLGEYLILTMHDELLWDIPASLLSDAVPTIRDIMCQGYRDVPTTTDIEVFDRHWDGAGVDWSEFEQGKRQGVDA